MSVLLFGQHGESKGDKHLAWLARQDVPTSDTVLSLLAPLHLSRQPLLLCFKSLSFRGSRLADGVKHLGGNSCSLAQSVLAGWAPLYQTFGQLISNFSLQHNTRIFIRRHVRTSGSFEVIVAFLGQQLYLQFNFMKRQIFNLGVILLPKCFQ